MDDLISRQAAIDALEKGRFPGAPYIDQGILIALREIKSLPSAQPEQRWIPVTERLPEEYKDVLCYYEYFRYGDYNCMFRTIDRGHYGNGRWGGEAGQGHKNKVLAWMPLPEPYKGA